MQLFLITMIATVTTFLLNPVFKKVRKQRPTKLHVHHSVFGVLLLAVGIIIASKVVAAIGLGIYLGHGVEEIYFNKRSPVRAFFIFVTRK